MEYKVFELPSGIATKFMMVDWCNPIAGLPTSIEKCGEIDSKVIDHCVLCKELKVRRKIYVCNNKIFKEENQS